jgi:NADPH:quinone reductase-like Zn-dependent oxidoreductase
MKAIVQDRYGSPDVLRLADIPVPVPKDGELLVRVHAAGVDPSVWHLMTGLPYMVRLVFGLRRPSVRVRGWDLAGRVEAVGPGVTGLGVGDEVFGVGRGSFAEYVCVRQDRCAAKPANLSFEQAAAVPVSACTALQALRDAGRLHAGQQVLVIGAGGGVGTFAVQLARAFGAEVTGVCSTAKVDLVRSLGAGDVIDYFQGDLGDGPRRWDLILDAGGRRPQTLLRRLLTPRGAVVLIGGEGGGRWTGGFIEGLLEARLLSLLSDRRVVGVTARVDRKDLLVLKGLIEAGQVAPAIDRVYPLAEAPEALRQLEQGRVRGKSVLRVVDGSRSP